MNNKLVFLILFHLSWDFIILTAGDLESDIKQAESSSTGVINSRKKRYVVFPEGSTFTV